MLVPLFNDHWAPFLTFFQTFFISNLFAYITLSIRIFFKIDFFLSSSYVVCLVFCGHISGQHVWVVTLLKPSNMTYTYDNSGHGNDNEKVNCVASYVADNKMPQQMEIRFSCVSLLFTWVSNSTSFLVH